MDLNGKKEKREEKKMNEDKSVIFLKRVQSYKRKCFGCLSFAPLIICCTLFVLILFFMLISFSPTQHRPNYIPAMPSRGRNRPIKPLTGDGQCDMEQLAYLTNNCLQQSILEGRTGNNYETSPQEKECVRYLKTDPRLVTLMSAYIDMIYKDICSYPEYAHQKSVEWFNRPLYYNHPHKKSTL